MYFGDYFLISFFICKYFLPFWGLFLTNWESRTDIYAPPCVKEIASGTTCCITQGAQLHALDMWGVRGRSKREGISVHIQLMHCLVQQKLTQHCKMILSNKRNFHHLFRWEILWGSMCINLLQSCPTNSLWPYGLQLTKVLCPWDSPGKNTGVGYHALLQGIVPTQEMNLCLLHLLHWQVGSLLLLPPGKPLCRKITRESYLLFAFHFNSELELRYLSKPRMPGGHGTQEKLASPMSVWWVLFE